jgi:flavodoxin
MDSPNPIHRRQVLTASLLAPFISTGPASAATDSKQRQASKVIVVYFSRTGNTRVIAGQIRRATGAALFEIEPVTPYPEDYQETVEQARRERDSGARPQLKSGTPDLVDFQTIYLGFPIWGETAPPVIRSFLANNDLSGKTLIPFITHGGYGTGNSLAVLAAHAPRARLLNTGFVMQADQEKQTLERVTGWLGKIGPNVGATK